MTTKPPRTREAVASTSDEAPSQRANGAGTARYRDRFAPGFAPDYFRAAPLHTTVSSIGIGTYLGEPTATDDEAYVASVEHAMRSGINVIDTAINYRGQRSERAVGTALRRLTASGDVSRDEVVLCSKGGYIPLDGQPPASRDEYRAYVKREFIDTEILLPAEIVGGGHSLAPRFSGSVSPRAARTWACGPSTCTTCTTPNSRRPPWVATSCGLESERRLSILEDAASRAERSASTAAPPGTGSASTPDATDHLELEELVGLARDAGGKDHHFRAVQMPINLAMPEAIRIPTQTVRGKTLPAAEAAAALDLMVAGSASLMQGKLTGGLPAALVDAFPSLETDAQRAIAFAQIDSGRHDGARRDEARRARRRESALPRVRAR